MTVFVFSVLVVCLVLICCNVDCVFVRQNIPAGLGHAVHCARHIVNDEPFAVILADDLMSSLKISAAGMRAQGTRLRVISQNIANANSLGTEPGQDPYRR